MSGIVKSIAADLGFIEELNEDSTIIDAGFVTGGQIL